MCSVLHETNIHVLFECALANAVWVDIGLWNSIIIFPGNGVIDVLKRVFANSSRDKCGLVVLVCWSLWNRRNKWLWNKVNMSCFGVKVMALNLLSDRKKAHEQQQVTTARTSMETAART